MIYLPDQLTRKSVTYTSVETTPEYRIWLSSLSPRGYEVHLRKFQEAADITLGGKEIHLEDKELFPNDEAFGRWAWTYPTVEQCRDKIQAVLTSRHG